MGKIISLGRSKVDPKVNIIIFLCLFKKSVIDSGKGTYLSCKDLKGYMNFEFGMSESGGNIPSAPMNNCKSGIIPLLICTLYSSSINC